MSSTESQPSHLNNLAILISLFYLSFLALTTRPIIFNDAQGYVDLAQSFLHEDWKNYFITGPNREPLYPIVLALTMRWAEVLGASYATWQIMMQMGLLVLTQILTRRILQGLHVCDGLTAAAVLWIGFSPALVNSGLIVYSEILSYPLILWSMLNISRVWAHLPSRMTAVSAARSGALLGSTLLLTTLVKSSFEPITLAVILIYAISALLAIKENPRSFKTALIIILTLVAVYQIPIVAIKLLNKKYNGNYTLTGRASTALRGNTLRLVEAPLNKNHLSSAASYIPGLEFCDQLKLKECYYWSVPYLDLRIQRSNEEQAQQSGIEEVSGKNLADLAGMIFAHPLPYVLYSSMEGLKILFWEGTQTSYLTYPAVIEHFYQNRGVQYALRFVAAALSLAAIIYGWIMTWKLRRHWWDLNDRDSSACSVFWIMTVVTLYMLMMSRFYLIPRYALPIAPLFIVLIAWGIDSAVRKTTRP